MRCQLRPVEEQVAQPCVDQRNVAQQRPAHVVAEDDSVQSVLAEQIHPAGGQQQGGLGGQ